MEHRVLKIILFRKITIVTIISFSVQDHTPVPWHKVKGLLPSGS